MSGTTLSHGAPTATALKGTIALDVDTPDVYQNTDGAATWVKLVRSGAVATLTGLTLSGFATTNGVAHFINGTGEIASSLIVAADIQGATITGDKFSTAGFSTGQVWGYNGTTFVPTTVSTATLGAVPTSRTVTGTAPVTVNGDNAAHDLSANLTVALGQAGTAGTALVATGTAWAPSTAFGSTTYASAISFTSNVAGAPVTIRSANAAGFPGIELHNQSDAAAAFIGYQNAATKHVRINAVLGDPIWLLISNSVLANLTATGLRIGDSTAAAQMLDVFGTGHFSALTTDGLVTCTAGVLGSEATITDAQHGTRGATAQHALVSVSAAGFAPVILGGGRILVTTGPDASATASWATAAGDWTGHVDTNALVAITGSSGTVTVHATQFAIDTTLTIQQSNGVSGAALTVSNGGNGDGALLVSQAAAGPGSNPYALKVTGGAHSSLSGEVPDIDFALGRTKTWTGSVTTQRDAIFRPATYAAASALTITSAATVAIQGAPAAGTNVTITSAYALWAQSGATRFDGPVLWNVGTAGGGVNASDLMLALNASATLDKVWLRVGGKTLSTTTPQYFVNVDPGISAVLSNPTKLITAYIQGQQYNLGGGTITVQQELTGLRVDAPSASSGTFAYAVGALGPLAIHAAGDVKVDGNVASITISTPGLSVDGLGQVNLFGSLLWNATETTSGSSGTLANPDKYLLVHVGGVIYKVPAFLGP